MSRLEAVELAMRELIAKEVEFELQAKNLDRPLPDDKADYPGQYPHEWYVAYGIHTGFNERLRTVLAALDGEET